MATQQEVIKVFMASLDKTSKKGTSALDEAIQASSTFSGVQAVINKMKSDIAKAGDATKFLKDYCGIDLTNTDTGAITGSDAGGSKVKTAASVVPESGSLKNFTGNSFYLSKYDITFYLSEIDNNGYVNMNSTLSFNDLSPKEQYIWQGLYTWWANNALDLITESYGSNFGFSSSHLITPKIIYFGFQNSTGSWGATTSPFHATSDKKETARLAIMVNTNSKQYGNINTTDSNGSNIGTINRYLDRALAHELTHAVMSANISYYYDLPQFISEGMAELTQGADDDIERQAYMKSLASTSALTTTGSNKSFFDSALDLTNTTTGDSKAYAGGYMFLRYFAKQAVSSGTIANSVIDNTINNKSLKGADNADKITNSGNNVTINAGAGNDTIVNFLKTYGGTGNYALINTGDGKDNISISGSYYVTVNGGADNDTINDNGGYKSYYNGGAGNDLISIKSIHWDFTLEGGKGNDTIISNNKNTLYKYAAGDGNDVIQGFNATSTLSISGGSYSTTKSGNNIIVTVGSSKVTLTNAASLSSVHIIGDSPVNINNSKSKTTLTGTAYNDTIKNTASNVTINGGAGNDSLHSERASNVLINGDNGDDTLGTFYVSSTNVTLNGGNGNDYIYNNGKTESAE